MAEIRIRKGFADRNGFNEIDSTIQIKHFSSYSRIAIKNKTIELFDEWRKQFGSIFVFENYVISRFAQDVFCVSIDCVDYEDIMSNIFECIEYNEYYDVLSLIEYFAKTIVVYKSDYDFCGRPSKHKVNIKDIFNELFEHECIGYRFVGDQIEQITSTEEISEIEKALQTPFDEKVNSHIRKALALLAETGNKDYENSIKESVTALEGLGALITKKSGTLADHIKIISKEYSLHPCLEQALSKLYAYSSDEGGIRHENKNKGYGVSFDEAKFILVLCSSSINYLIGVCNKDLSK